VRDDCTKSRLRTSPLALLPRQLLRRIEVELGKPLVALSHRVAMTVNEELKVGNLGLRANRRQVLEHIVLGQGLNRFGIGGKDLRRAASERPPGQRLQRLHPGNVGGRTFMPQAKSV
jgi:hypothetical protein